MNRTKMIAPVAGALLAIGASPATAGLAGAAGSTTAHAVTQSPPAGDAPVAPRVV